MKLLWVMAVFFNPKVLPLTFMLFRYVTASKLCSPEGEISWRKVVVMLQSGGSLDQTINDEREH